MKRLPENIMDRYTLKKYRSPQTQKVRKIENIFAWVDHHLMRNAFFDVMIHNDMVLYLFLISAGDRNGVFLYPKEKTCGVVSLDFNQFDIARDRLVNIKLIAFENYLVLPPNRYYETLPIEDKSPDYSKKLMQNISINCSGLKQRYSA